MQWKIQNPIKPGGTSRRDGPSAVTIYPKGTPVPTPTVEVQVLETRVDLSNDMTGRDMLAVGVRNVVLARGMLDKLEGPKYAERRAELRRKAREAARARDRQTTAASQNEADAPHSKSVFALK